MHTLNNISDCVEKKKIIYDIFSYKHFLTDHNFEGTTKWMLQMAIKTAMSLLSNK